MPTTIPGVVLPGDLEYKNTMLVMPKDRLYSPHQSRLFWLKMIGRPATDTDIDKIAEMAGGRLTADYVSSKNFEKNGLAGIVFPSIQTNFKDEKKTVFNWEEHDIDDTADVQGTFTAIVAAPAVGTETTYTVSSTTKLRKDRVVKHIQSGMQLVVSSIVSATQFKAYVAQNTFTSGNTFPGTDVQAAGSAVAVNDTYLILAPAQSVGGTPIQDEFSRPVQRRNAFQTVAYEFEVTGHAKAEDGTHATVTTDLASRKFQQHYRALCAIDDTYWDGKYARGTYGTGEEKYFMDGIRANIGTSTALNTFAGTTTTLTADNVDDVMRQVTKVNMAKDLIAVGSSTIALAINKLGRANTTIDVEPAADAWGTSYLKIHTHRGTVKFFELPTTKLLGDTNNVLRFLNTKYLIPVMRNGRSLKWENGVKKDGTQDARYDVYRGDASICTFHKTAHEEITGITG